MAATDNPYGWHAVPRNPAIVLDGKSKIADPKPYTVAELPLPDSTLIKLSLGRAKSDLPPQTLNHSLRVYHYGMAIISDQFPHWLSEKWISPETWLLTCFFHDIGTTDKNLHGTHMSFDFWGGIEALQTLLKFGAPKSQAESVSEAILRHQDPGEIGTISCMGLLVQMATEFDNMGHYKEMVHMDTVKSVVDAYPRMGWSGCFSKFLRNEIGIKPWCHSTAIEGFADMVENNGLMKPFD